MHNYNKVYVRNRLEEMLKRNNYKCSFSVEDIIYNVPLMYKLGRESSVVYYTPSQTAEERIKGEINLFEIKENNKVFVNAIFEDTNIGLTYCETIAIEKLEK